MKHQRALIAVGVAIGLLVSAGAVLASTNATIRGNAKANTLRGTAGSDAIWGLGGNDKLYGGAGNDKLYGGAGNDLLVGGPGADVISCGPGDDKVVGGPGDKAAADCEHVSGIPAPGGGGGGGGGGGSANPPPPKPACSDGLDNDNDGKIDYPADPGCDSASDTDETDPAPSLLPGTYCGFSEQGPGVCVTTSADARSVVKFQSESIMDCSAGDQSFRVNLTVEAPDAGVPIQADRSFSFTFDGTEPDSNGFSNIHESYFIKGAFSTDGKADGTFAFTNFSFDYSGVHFACSQNPVAWHTTKQ